MGSHKTKEQLENELNELKSILMEKSSECDFLTKDNRAKSEAVANACADLKNKGKDLEDARAGLKDLKESNKKLTDQFYEYRSEFVKVRKELADAIENRDSFKVELEGVRGALKRESEMRAEAEKKCGELREKLVKTDSEFEAFKKAFNDKDIECDELRNNAWKWDKIHELMNAHGIDTMSKLKDALVELEHKREDVESLKTSLADSCAAKIKEGRDLTGKIESLERELCSTKKAMARDAEEARKLLGWYNNLKKLYDKARKEGEEGCAMWRESTWKVKDERDRWIDRAFRDEEELKKVKEHDRMAQENFEKAARKNDELQNEVYKLRQRWTDKFNPEDEMLGRKVLEWQEINVLLAKHNIENSMVLGAELDMLKEYRKVLDKHGITGQTHLDESLEKLERSQQMLRDWHYPIRSLGEDWRDVVDKHHVVNHCDLENRLSLLEKYQSAAYDLQKSDGFKWLSETVSGRRE